MALPAQHRILPLRGGVAQTEYVQGNVGHLEACVIGYYLNSGGNGCNLEGTLKDRLVTSPEEVKVFVAAAPVTGEPFTFKRTVSVAGIEVPVFTEAVPWKVA